MAKKCKCAICGQEFDREKIQAVIHGPRRYSHYDCEPDKPLAEAPTKIESPEKKELMDYISKIYGNKANYPLINKQIKEFLKQGYTLSGILKSLVYFYEVKNNTPEKSNGGIGIIQYCYDDAKNYYYAIWLAQQSNAEKKITNTVKEYTIPTPRRKGIKAKFLEWIEE